MKATVNNSANFVINNDMLNETKCLKYVSKPTMLEEIVNIQVAQIGRASCRERV